MLFPKVCVNCVPPKRSEDCHSYCPEYLEAKEQYEAEQSIEREKRMAERDADCAVRVLTRR